MSSSGDFSYFVSLSGNGYGPWDTTSTNSLTPLVRNKNSKCTTFARLHERYKASFFFPCRKEFPYLPGSIKKNKMDTSLFAPVFVYTS